MDNIYSKISTYWLGLLLLTQTTQVYAQEAVSESVNQVAPEVGKHVATSGMDLASMLTSLVLVMALIIISAIVLKKFQLGNQSTKGLKIISSLHLGTKERLVVVEINKKQLLLGVTAQQINVLDTLDEPLTPNQPLTMEVGQQFMKAFKK